MRDLVIVWMNVSRQTSWNGRKVRKEWAEGTTARVYQDKGLAMLRKRFDIWVGLWTFHVFVHAVMGATVAFIVVFLLGFIIAAARDDMHSLLVADYVITPIFACFYGLGMFVFYFFENFYRDIGPDTHLGLTLPPDSRDSDTIYLSGVIQAIRERGATDPKDRSFGVYGVLRRLSVLLSQPDYAKTRARIYQELLVDLIRWQPRMINLVLDAGIASRFADVPSWVPDWTIAAERCYFDTDYLYYHTKRNATWKWVPSVTVDGNSLHVAGVWKGVVNFSCGPFNGVGESSIDDYTDDDTLWAQILRLATWILHTRRNATTAYSSVPESVRRVLREPSKAKAVAAEGTKQTTEGATNTEGTALLTTAGQAAETAEAAPTSEEQQGFDSAYRFLSSIDSSSLDKPGVTKNNGLSLRAHLQDSPNGTRALAFIVKTINQLASGRRTVFTSYEGYVGTGPMEISVGDRIALVAGIAVPLVLRESQTTLSGNDSSETCEVIGPAVIDGYMLGEAGEMKSQNVETITLV
jgi:hypothetical protein